MVTSTSNSSVPNPRSRNSEIGDPMRRSFSGSPFAKPSAIANPRGFDNPSTPANSPSGFSRRNSFGTVPRRDSEDKENEKDQNRARSRSPAPPNPKAAKNFMSPTISAASKMNSQPKKKILTEKNESARTSVSFSDVRTLIMEESNNKPPCRSVTFSDVRTFIPDNNEPLLTEVCPNMKQPASPDDMTVTDLDNKEPSESSLVSEQKSGFAVEDNCCVNLDSSFKISPRPSGSYVHPVAAQLDAKPSPVPYDPKTNYLSPRPRFLHYRPNPRIEVYLNKETEGKQLEEIFTSECSSDADITDEESHWEGSTKYSENQSPECEREPEDESQGDEMGENEEGKEEEEAEAVTRRPFFLKSKFMALLLVLSIAYFSIPNTPPTLNESPLFQNLSSYEFYVPPEIVGFSKATFDQLGQKLKVWSKDCRAYIQEQVSRIREVQNLGPLQFHNLTEFLDGQSFDTVLEPIRERVEAQVWFHNELDFDETMDEEEDLGFEGPKHDSVEGNHVEIVPEENGDDWEQEIATEAVQLNASYDVVELEKVESSLYLENESQLSNEQQTINDGTDVRGQSNEQQQTIVAETFESDDPNAKESLEDAVELEYGQSGDRNGNEQQGSVISDINVTGQLGSLQAVELGSDESININSEKESTKSEENLAEETIAESFPTSYYRLASAHNMLVLSLIALSLIAALAVFFAKNATPSAAKPSPVMITKENLDYGPVSATVEKLIKEKLASLNFATEVDMSGDSCSSEMSSLKKTSIQSKKGLNGSSEGHSQERSRNRRSNTYRRESLASSASEYSMGSASYGSFTTYEKIPVKKAHGDEDVVTTPVRRSSRLRSQVSSQ